MNYKDYDEDIVKKYREYQLMWMLDHDITLRDAYELADEYASDEELRDCYVDFESYLEDVGFEGELWACIDEWYDLDYEWPEEED